MSLDPVVAQALADLDAPSGSTCPGQDGPCGNPLSKNDLSKDGLCPGCSTKARQEGARQEADERKHLENLKRQQAAAQRALARALEADPDAVRHTDLGNAIRFRDLCQGDALFTPELGWMVWAGTHWQQDDQRLVEHLARRVTRRLFEEAVDDKLTAEQKQKAFEWAMSTEGRSRFVAMLEGAKALLMARHAEFDQHPMLLNTPAGVVDLATGQVQPHDRDLRLSKLTGCGFDAAAACPRWEAFVRQVMGGSDALVDYLQRAVGYSLTGLYDEHVMLVLYGTGANGKSTMLEALRLVLGDYAQALPAETLMQKKSAGGASSELARMRGARMAAAVEADEGRRLDEGLVKRLTGGDTVSARYLYREYFEFQNTAKLWLATNHKPRIVGTDDGIWRRLHLVPFAVSIPKDEQVQGLAQQLVAEEGPGILAWAVRGCQVWRQAGLQPPPLVVAATDEYRQAEDMLNEFLDERCVVQAGATTPAGELYKAYRSWALDCGLAPVQVLDTRKFKGRMQDRGFVWGRTKQGKGYTGVGLLAPAHRDAGREPGQDDVPF
jgi:putative DNA primase/helicase